MIVQREGGATRPAFPVALESNLAVLPQMNKEAVAVWVASNLENMGKTLGLSAGGQDAEASRVLMDTEEEVHKCRGRPLVKQNCGRRGASVLEQRRLHCSITYERAISLREMEDIASLEEKLGRSLSKEERSRIGVSSLRLFLEDLLQKRYMDSVPLIIPLLEKEYRGTTRKLNEINQELGNLDEMKLKEKGRTFHDLFLTKLSLLLKGTVVAPPDKFGETLQDERVNGGAFVGSDGLQFPYKLIPNAGMRLYGGAQYHRAMAEFRFVVGGTKCPPITREEIVNACGVEDIHDGTNYSRTACVIAVAKARDTFEPFLHQLGFRLLHILKRLLPISVYLLRKDGEYLSGHEVFLRRVASAFNNFAESTERACREKCMEDLVSTTRYVTWSLHNKNRAGLRQFLDSFGGSEQSTQGCNSPTSVAQESSFGTVANDNKHDIKPRADVKLSHLASGIDSSNFTPAEDLESAFEDDLDMSLTSPKLTASIGERKRDMEIELKRNRD
ncbi:hypothetical protein HHK36_008921 [Tetracentron sinense]|uniref:Uncharacterized protein n=1 Tax=Tetracentron sinense TaxID=13715 RepID=A0A835DL67_TETSI|nr:hypothetical protein HHK36_008921 [Tetracentron sinense]